MHRWDIYFADVPFDDVPQSKLRPVIVLDDNAVVVACIKMTTHPPRPGEYALKRWAEAGLHKQTTVRISKILSLKKSCFKFKIGAVHPLDIHEIQKLLTL